MSLSDSLNSILTENIPTAFSRFGRDLDAEWIHEALEETGTASVRRRKIPAELVVWLVIGMAMFRDQAISVVVKHLGLTLPSQRNKNGPAGGTSVVPGAIPAARYRVGAAPIELIFKRTALTWAIAAAEKHPWKGLPLFGVDGTTLRLQDTDENREAFGLPPSSRGQAGYPQTRIVTLMALCSHLIAGVAFGPCRGKETGEQTLARQLWPQLPEKSLTIVDKGFMDYVRAAAKLMARMADELCGPSPTFLERSLAMRKVAEAMFATSSRRSKMTTKARIPSIDATDAELMDALRMLAARAVLPIADNESTLPARSRSSRSPACNTMAKPALPRMHVLTGR